MPVGVRAFATFVPAYRLSRATIQDAWSQRAGSKAQGVRATGDRAIAAFDEDALTLACEAALPIAEAHVKAGGAIGSVLFASTSSPYAEKSAAALLAGACDLPFERVRTADFGGSARAGAQALISACERLACDSSAADALVTASEVRTPPPESEHEGVPGDAGAALLVGRGGLIAEIVATHSVTAEILDTWRAADDRFVRTADSKFAQSAGFAPAMRSALYGALATAKVEARDVAKFALGAPSAAAAAALLKAVGVDPAKLAPSFEAEIGHTGTAQAFLSLASALEQAKEGDVVVLGAWGDGADVVVLRATGRSSPSPRPVGAQVSSGRDLGYARYLKARRLAGADFDAGPEATNVLFAKEQAQNLRLHGAKCRHCGTVQFPAQSTCIACRKEGTDRVRLSRHGKVFTFTKDALDVAAEPLTVMAVVDLDGGGRMYLPMTDVDPETVEIGTPVELTFRYYHSGSDFRQYFWKARPLRG